MYREFQHLFRLSSCFWWFGSCEWQCGRIHRFSRSQRARNTTKNIKKISHRVGALPQLVNVSSWEFVNLYAEADSQNWEIPSHSLNRLVKEIHLYRVLMECVRPCTMMSFLHSIFLNDSMQVKWANMWYRLLVMATTAINVSCETYSVKKKCSTQVLCKGNTVEATTNTTTRLILITFKYSQVQLKS